MVGNFFEILGSFLLALLIGGVCIFPKNAQLFIYNFMFCLVRISAKLEKVNLNWKERSQRREVDITKN